MGEPGSDFDWITCIRDGVCFNYLFKEAQNNRQNACIQDKAEIIKTFLELLRHQKKVQTEYMKGQIEQYSAPSKSQTT